MSGAAVRSHVRDRWSPLRGHVLAPLLDRWYGRRTRAYVPAVARRLALPDHAMRAARLEALRSLLVHARDTVPLHRARMAAAGFDPAAMRHVGELACLPPLTREEVAERAGELLSSVRRGRSLVEARSGGTTSDPVPFMQPTAALWRKNAAAFVLRRRLGWRRGARTAALWGAVEDMPAAPEGVRQRVKAGLLQGAERALWLPASDLSPGRLDEFVEALRRFRPAALQAYPSAADLLARRILERHPRLELPLVLLTAETVFPAQRERIASALGARVHSFYGAREVGWIACECPEERRLHLNTDGIHLEVDDDGRILVTDLVNYAMPLIRYAVGDRGVLAAGRCPCGDPRPVLAALHGRANDVFVLPSGRRVPGSICDVRNYQLVDGIVETQLVQEVPERLRVRWVAGPNYRPEHLGLLRAFLDKTFDGELTYAFERVEEIEPEPNGKTRYCVSFVEAAS